MAFYIYYSEFFTYRVDNVFFLILALGLIALDTRLGCFEAKEGSESQRLIDAVNTFFLCVGQLELKAPWWRLYPTTMFKQYVAALDNILRYLF